MDSVWSGLSRALIIFGLIVAALGVVLLIVPKVPWIGRLPGDILIQRDRVTFYFPFASCLVASVILSLILWIVGRFR